MYKMTKNVTGKKIQYRDRDQVLYNSSDKKW